MKIDQKVFGRYKKHDYGLCDMDHVKSRGGKAMMGWYCDNSMVTKTSKIPSYLDDDITMVTLGKKIWVHISGSSATKATVYNQLVAMSNAQSALPYVSATANQINSAQSGMTPSVGYERSDDDYVEHRTLTADYQMTLDLPDGGRFVYEKGSYRVEDKDAKVTYKANRTREFNRHLNASDLLADFIADIGKLGARQDNALQVPIEAFVTWLVFKAAETDGEPAPNITPVAEMLPRPGPPDIPRCRCCQAPLPPALAREGIRFLDHTHMLVFMKREGLAA